jgi:hypothetical protein
LYGNAAGAVALTVFGGFAAVFGGFVPGFGVAYFPLQVFGVERGLVQFFAGGLRRPCFSSVHDKCEPTTAPKRDTGCMKVLNFLVESFVNTFGITRPRPEQQRTVALTLGGFLLLFFIVLFGLIFWMLFGVKR